jgi:hypothetical protein
MENYGKCMVGQMAKKPILVIDEPRFDDERVNKALTGLI